MQQFVMPTEKGFFAQRLKELRGQAGLSQPALAERSGVAVGTIRHFEYGIREPTYETLVKLADGLGVTLLAFDPKSHAEADSPPALGKPRRGRPPKSGGAAQVKPRKEKE
jgi:transcriptional regulator with XRE-family HTH domain